MDGTHWLILVAAIVIGYILGAKYPSWGAKIGL